jgi:parvulin-like peptidyl-prolyl isomerase
VLTTEEELQAYLARERSAALELLEGLAARVRDGEDFGALVRTYSQDPLTRDRGGRGEGRFELHTWPEEVQQRLRALEPGGVIGPLEVGGEFLLLELAGRVLVPLEEVADALRAELLVRPPTQVEVAGFVNQLTREVRVDLLLEAWR